MVLVPIPTLRNSTYHWSPPGQRDIDHNSLSVTIQLIPYPPSGLSIKPMPLQFRDKDGMWDSVECFALKDKVPTAAKPFYHIYLHFGK